LVSNGTLTANMANFLISAVKAHANILICGEMGAGKSVMLSLLAQNIGDNERLILIEEVPEIFMNNPDVTRVTYNVKNAKDQDVTLSAVLDGALYGRYDRIIIGELHDVGAYRMLRVMATGGDGSLCTFHAGDARSALDQIRNHVLLEYPQLPANTVADFIRQAINVVVVVENIDGHRVKEIAEVEWRNLSDANAQIGVNRLFYYDRKGEHESLHGQPGHIADGRLDQDGKLREKGVRFGVEFKQEWFSAGTFGHR
jgi:pilus assembly protein CpaF